LATNRRVTMRTAWEQDEAEQKQFKAAKKVNIIGPGCPECGVPLKRTAPDRGTCWFCEKDFNVDPSQFREEEVNDGVFRVSSMGGEAPKAEKAPAEDEEMEFDITDDDEGTGPDIPEKDAGVDKDEEEVFPVDEDDGEAEGFEVEEGEEVKKKQVVIEEDVEVEIEEEVVAEEDGSEFVVGEDEGDGVEGGEDTVKERSVEEGEGAEEEEIEEFEVEFDEDCT